MRLLAMFLLASGCNQPPECQEDENVRADFSVSPEPSRENSSWVEEPCTVAGVVGGIHTLVCAGLVDELGTDTINLFLLTAPEMMSPLRSGDSVTFTYYDGSHIRSDQYFLLRRGGSLAIAGQLADSIGPRYRIILNDFYFPASVELAATQCRNDCGRTTRVGLRLSGEDVFDQQFRTTSNGSVWVESAYSFDHTGSCDDTSDDGFYDFIIASP